jgi:hypothetical protein
MAGDAETLCAGFEEALAGIVMTSAIERSPSFVAAL